MFNDFNESPENLVEIELSFEDFSYPYPVRNSDSLLTFGEAFIDAPTLKVNVPKEVAQDKALLNKYYQEKLYDADCHGGTTVNIWEENKEDFKFPW